LKKGEFVVAQDAFSPVRSISDWRGTTKDYAQMGEPALVTGWNKLPRVGIPFFTVKERKMAEKMIEEYANNKKNEIDITTEVNTADRQVDVVIPIIIKADVIGSLEAIKHEINKIRVPRVAFKTLLEGIGSISENDAKNASVFPGSLVLGFNVEIDNRAQILIERNHIECKTFKIIYELTEFLKKVAEERRPREIVEKVVGKVKILKVFQKEKDRHILGGKVTEGSIKIGDEFRLVRRDNELCRGKIRELQRQKNKVEEIVAATECGILAQAEKAISEGDILEVFIKEEI
jgi:translation initiation factor IF-2